MTPLTPAGQAMDVVMKHALEHAYRNGREDALAELRREVEGLPGRSTKPGPFGTALAWPLEPQEFRLAVLALIDKASKPEEGA